MAQKFTVPITVKQLTSAGSDAITVYVDADTYARLKVEAGGRLVWGSGSGTGDVTLYRESADVLKTDDDFKVGGKLSVTASSGEEGGEIFLAQPQTNNTLNGGVTIDVYQNKIRFFEQGGSARGAYIDLTAATGGAGTNLLAGSGGATTLDGLTDVTAPTPSVGDLIQWNGTAWVNVASTTVGATNLDGLSDVVITSPTRYQVLQYDGTNWVNVDGSVTTYVRNAETTTLNIGEVVYLYQQQGDRASVKRAINTGDSTSAKTLGVVAAAIPANSDGPVVTQGYVYNCNLGSFTAGQTVYLSSTAGQITATKPYAPNHIVYIGVVVRANNGNGIIYVRAQNGYELDEIHDVDLITTPPVAGDFLKYNGSLWVNDAIDLGTDTNGNYMSGVTAGTGITVTHTPGEGSTATITNAGVTSVNGSTGAITGVVRTSDTGTVTSTMIADGTIVNADVNASAAIAHSKLANATAGQVLLGTTTTGVVTATTVSGDVTIDGAGVTTIGSGVIVNADINASAAIDKTKISGTAITAADTGTVTSTMIADGTIVNADISNTAAIALSKLSTTGASAGYVISYNGSAWTAASAAAGGAKVTVSDTPPSSPTTGDMWFESDTTRTYVYYDSFWVEIGGLAPAASVSDTAPTSPVTGQVWFNSLNGGTYVYYSGAWVEIGAVPVNNLLNLIDAKGDLYVGSADNTAAKLSVGTTGYVLTADSTATYGVKWAAIPPSGGLSTTTEGAIMTMAIGA